MHTALASNASIALIWASVSHSTGLKFLRSFSASSTIALFLRIERYWAKSTVVGWEAYWPCRRWASPWRFLKACNDATVSNQCQICTITISYISANLFRAQGRNKYGQNPATEKIVRALLNAPMNWSNDIYNCSGSSFLCCHLLLIMAFNMSFWKTEQTTYSKGVRQCKWMR